VDFRFLHAADLHLDTPFEGIEQVSPEVAGALRDASLAAFDDLVECAITRKAAFVLLAGDIYDGVDRGVRAQLRFLRGLERLSGNGIGVFVVHGNHDPLGGWSAIRKWPPGVHIFGSDAVESFPFEIGGGRGAVIHGISYDVPGVRENLALKFRAAEGPGLQIGLLHCHVSGSSEHAPYAPCSLEDLCKTGMDYWALGHIHRFGILREKEPWVVYPGNLQGRSPKPSERGAKGACLVEVKDGVIESVSHVALDRVRFCALDVDIEEAGDLAELSVLLDSRAERLREENEGRGLVVRVFLTGRGRLSGELKREGAREGILRDLREEWEGRDPFLWWESVRDETRLSLDLEVVRRRGDFSAELLELADSLKSDPEPLRGFLTSRVRESPLRKVERWIGRTSEEEIVRDLEEAERLALELLEEAEESG